ncbi:MAG: hypothetical protein COB76_00015 [Alphaproteobacteria bacterium]|nr:MAG: hypothetical protein COB76_00015 [Alphaproteobacteria bacterium]
MADFFGGTLHKNKKKSDDPYFDQSRKRSVEFIQVPNDLKDKVGSGGLDQKIIEAAQKIIEKNDVDFVPQAQRHLSALREGLRLARTQRDKFEIDGLLATIAQPTILLKSNGAMFGYPLVTKITDLMIRFIEVLEDLDDDALDVVQGFSSALNAVIVGEMRGFGGEDGKQLYQALEDACQRYFEKDTI